MPLTIKLYFRSGKTLLLENPKYTEELVEQLNAKIKAGIIVDFDVF